MKRVHWISILLAGAIYGVCAGDVKAAAFVASERSFFWTSGGLGVELSDRQAVYRFADAAGAVRISYQARCSSGPEGLEETGPHAYSSIVFRRMWRGIDLLYSVYGSAVKSEFQLEAGADPDEVRWRVDGADAVWLARDGSLIILAGGHQIREDTPQVFEQDRSSNALRPVAGAFRMLGPKSVGIEVGAYDHQNRLIFDPVIGYSTFFGGSGQSVATAVAVDSQGNAVVAGYTTSLDLAPNARTFGSARQTVAYVAKFSASGNQLMFCDYIGGSLDNRAFAVALDRWDNIYIAGQTSSTDFPLVRPVQARLKGQQNAFVAELKPDGSSLVFSTYLGGSAADQAYAIAVNHIGQVFVAGDTTSPDFPVSRGYQATEAGGADAFVAKLGISGTSLIASTFFGGSADEHCASMAVDGEGGVVIAGSTMSTNLPVLAAAQPQSGGNQDAFLARFNDKLSGLVFSTYFGGSGGTSGLPENAAGVAVGPAGGIYVTGTTSSANFPVTPGAFLTTFSGGITDAWAASFTSTGSLVYSTYLGGSSVDFGMAVAVDSAGNAEVTGYTASPDFPVARAIYPQVTGYYAIFLTKFNSNGSGLVYSTLMGGSQDNGANAVAVDANGTAYIAGQTNSPDFPTSSALQTAIPGAGSSVVVRIPVGWRPAVMNSGSWTVDALLNNGSAAALNWEYGQAGDIPVVGDWTGTGHQNIGVFRQGTWFLDTNGNGVLDSADRTFVFGQAGDVPVAGDWNGTGRIAAGLFRNGQFILDLSGHLSGTPTGLQDLTVSYGQPGDIPVVGDWNGSGSTKLGVFRGGAFLLDWTGTHAPTAPTLNFGETNDTPLAGDWDGSGVAKIGVYRNGVYLLDLNGDGVYEPQSDVTLPYGSSNGTPLTID